VHGPGVSKVKVIRLHCQLDFGHDNKEDELITNTIIFDFLFLVSAAGITRSLKIF